MQRDEFQEYLTWSLRREAADPELQNTIRFHTRERLLRREAAALREFMTDEMLGKEIYGDDTEENLRPISWLGFPSREVHQDLVALQELLWTEKPARIILTGARDAGVVAMLASFSFIRDKSARVICVDSKLPAEVRQRLSEAPFGTLVEFLDKHTLDPTTKGTLADATVAHKTMVMLDSAFVGDTPWRELEAYAPLVTVGTVLVVMGAGLGYGFTDILDFTELAGRRNATGAVPWFLGVNPSFVLDDDIVTKFHVSAQRGGVLRRVS